MRFLIAASLVAHVGLAGLLQADEVPLTPETVVHFATVEEARKVLGTRDEFVSRMSPFDRAVRMKTDRPVSEEQFLKAVAGGARAWETEEIETLKRSLRVIGPELSRMQVDFPKRILMIKAEGIESEAAHTRGQAVVLPRERFRSGRTHWQQLLAHELLHVLTRHDPDLRRALYAAIGFRPCNEIELPEELKPRKITNPDAPWNDSYITVTVQGRPADAVPVLFSKGPYDPARGGGIFRYLNFQLLAIERTGDRFGAKHRDGEPVLLDLGEVSGFHEQVGRNTGYIIHPEEIIAENFALLVTGKQNLPSPEIAEKIRQVLATKRPKLSELSVPGRP